MSRGSVNFEDESIEEERDQDFNQFEGLHISATQQELVEDTQEINRGIGARVSTDPRDQPAAQLPPLPLSPGQESSHLQRDQDSNINSAERVIEEATLTRMDTAADGSETVPMVAAL